MIMNTIRFVALAALLATDCHAAADVRASLVGLIADGAKYDGKRIVVTGYICDVPASVGGLFLTLEDCQLSNVQNAVAVDLPVTDKAERVILTGVFENRADKFLTDDPYVWGAISGAWINHRLDVSEGRSLQDEK